MGLFTEEGFLRWANHRHGGSTRLSVWVTVSTLKRMAMESIFKGSPSPIAGCCLYLAVVVRFLRHTYLLDIWALPRELMISS